MKTKINTSILFIKYVTLFLLSPCFAISQNAEKSDYFIFSGKIENIAAKKNGKKAIRLHAPFNLNDSLDRTISMQPDGSFYDTIYSGSGLYNMFDGENMVPLYFMPSKSYQIKYNKDTYSKLGHVFIAGNDTSITRYYLDKSQNRVYPSRDDTQSEDSYTKMLIEKRRDELLRLEKSKLPAAIYQYEAKFIQYDYLSELYYFIDVKSAYDTTYTPSKNVLKEISIDFSNEAEYKDHPYYAKMVRINYEAKLAEIYTNRKKLDATYSRADHSQRILFYYDSLSTIEYIKNDLIKQDVTYYLQNAKNKEQFYNDFKKYYTGHDEKLKTEVYSNYLRFEKLKVGTTSPKFSNFLNITGDRNSLDDFKGKYVFIDVWATWCGNCYREFPFIKKLELDYQSKELTFLSLCLDELENKWREQVKKQGLTGVQLLANPKDKFFEDYAIDGIPRYILLDPEGKIIDHNAPRPSQTEELQALFKSVGL